MGKTISCIGCARSGKSTFCRKYKYEHPNTIVLNCDSFRLAMSGDRYNYLCEPLIHGLEKVAFRAIRLSNQDSTIILDETHTTYSSILDVFKLDDNAEFVYLDTPLQTCVERAHSSGQPDLEDVIYRMWANLEKLCSPHKIGEGVILAKVEEIREDYKKNHRPLERIV